MKWTFKEISVFSELLQTLLSLIYYTHEMNIQRNLGSIELLMYQSIYSGPLDFDIYEFYCIYK